MEIHGNPLILGYFSGFFWYFLDFWSNIRVFGQNKIGIVQTPPRSAEINRYFVKRSHLDPKRHTFDENTTPLKMIISRLCFLALRRSGMSRRLRDLRNSILILSNGAVWTRNVTLLKTNIRAHMGPNPDHSSHLLQRKVHQFDELLSLHLLPSTLKITILQHLIAFQG